MRRHPLSVAIAISVVVLAFAAVGVARADDPVELSEWLPEWEVGLFWEVETQPLAVAQPKAEGGVRTERIDEKVIVRFEVTGTKKLDGNDCFEVTVTSKLLPETWRVLYVRRVDLSLAELHTVTKGRGGEESRTVVRHDRGTFVFLEETVLCPLDLPRWPTQDEDAEREGTLAGTGIAFVERHRFESKDGRTVLHVEIETEQNGRKLVSRQSWRKDSPWWIEAKRTIGDREAEIGKLVKVGKKKD